MEPLFKIGQKVTIKDIGNDKKSDYPFSFVSGMQGYKNLTFEIIRIRPGIRDYSSSKYHDEYDGYCYELDHSSWNWSSPMFQETYEL